MQMLLNILLLSWGTRLLLWGYPNTHLLLVVVSCLFMWFKYPKHVLKTSLIACGLLCMHQYLPIIKAVQILVSHPVLLLVIGCMLSRIIVVNQVHAVIASNIVASVKPECEYTLVCVMMLISAFLSMWISNTSAVAMLIPVVMTLSESLEIKCNRLLLAIAYGATLGGMLTPIGTPSNLLAVSYASRYFNIDIDFAMWFYWAAPFVSSLFVVVMVFFWMVSSHDRFEPNVSAIIPSTSQKKVMFCLMTCVGLWGLQTFPYGGWASLIGTKIPEEWIGGAILFMISTIQLDEGRRAFALKDCWDLPFGSIATVVTGIFVAESLMHAGIIQNVIDALANVDAFQDYQALSLFGIVLSMATELCSNTAVTSLGLPLAQIMMKISNLKALPCIFLITMSANSAFMLPTSSPPNALIMGTGKLSSRYMIGVGLAMSCISLLLLTICMV